MGCLLYTSSLHFRFLELILPTPSRLKKAASALPDTVIFPTPSTLALICLLYTSNHNDKNESPDNVFHIQVCPPMAVKVGKLSIRLTTINQFHILQLTIVDLTIFFNFSTNSRKIVGRTCKDDRDVYKRQIFHYERIKRCAKKVKFLLSTD